MNWFGKPFGHRLRTAGTAILVLLGIGLLPRVGNALGETKYVSTSPGPGDFVLAANGQATTLVVSGEDWPGVVRAMGDLSQDVGRVT